MNKLKEYLWVEWKYNVHSKFYKYFEEWFINLTETQILYYTAYMNGKTTFFIKEF